MPGSERLSPQHSVQTFVSGNDELDTWLRDSARTADRAGTSRVYVWLDDQAEVIGYFAIAPHNIRREDVPSSVGRGAPNTRSRASSLLGWRCRAGFTASAAVATSSEQPSRHF